MENLREASKHFLRLVADADREMNTEYSIKALGGRRIYFWDAPHFATQVGLSHEELDEVVRFLSSKGFLHWRHNYSGARTVELTEKGFKWEFHQSLLEPEITQTNIREVVVIVEPATAAAFLSALASASTIAKNVRDWLVTGSAPDKQAVLEQADEAGASLASDSQARDFVLRITDQVFNPIDGRIKRARKKLEEVLGDPYLPKERRRVVMDECDESICEALNDIKRYNGGTLPEHLQEFWDEHGCSGRP
jgi:hypothetical protein